MKITKQFAALIREKGCKIDNCTYHQLIDWVFDFKEITCVPCYLKFWYNMLKDSPLKHEFNGRLLDFFESQYLHLVIETDWVAFTCTILTVPEEEDLIVKNPNTNNNYFGWKHHAKDEGIVQMFKLLIK